MPEEYKTIRVPKSSFETAKSTKREDESWGDFVERCSGERVITMTERDVRDIVRDEFESLTRR